MRDFYKEFIPYDLALRMKPLGYNEPCLKYVYYRTIDNEKIECIDTIGVSNTSGCVKKHDKSVAIPTWQSAFSWLISKIDDEFKLCLDQHGWFIYNLDNEEFKGSQALKKLIEIVEKK